MSAVNDAKLALHAEIHATRDAVTEACRQAATILGTHATTTASAAKVTVIIRAGMIPAMSSESPIVGIALRPGKEGTIIVDATIERYRTIQSTFFFVRVGPKRLVGMSSYKNLLRSLKNELQAIDTGQGSIAMTGASGR